MTHAMDVVFIGGLATWTLFSLLRFIDMYNPESPYQLWRRWDIFHLVPVGAFFSPGAPQSEAAIVVREFLSDGAVTAWAEVPVIRSRVWWHALWNSQKPLYRAKLAAANALLEAAGTYAETSDRLPSSFLLSDPYLAILEYVSQLPRTSQTCGMQFAVIEQDLLTRSVLRTVLSSVHEV